MLENQPKTTEIDEKLTKMTKNQPKTAKNDRKSM